MNSTQPCLKIQYIQRKRDHSFIKQPLNIMIAEQQIHKCPVNVRKSMKLGKYKKSYRVTEREKNSSQEKTILAEKQRLQMNIKIKQIFQNQSQNPIVQVSSLMNSIQHETQKSHSVWQVSNAKSQKITNTTDRMLYYRKKLSPIKKLNLSEQKANKSNLKITFLNIEKVELIKMYSNIPKQKYKKEQQSVIVSEDRYQQSNLSRKRLHQLLESTAFSTNRKIAKIDQKSKTHFKFKPFSPPFQRYYYKDFIWKVAFSNNLKFASPEEYPSKFKAYIGKGNNSLLVKSLIKRRGSWWTFTEKIEDAQFIWTQIKCYDIFKLQKSTDIIDSFNQNEKCQFEDESEKISLCANSKILNKCDLKLWKKYSLKHRLNEDKMNEEMTKRNKYLTKPKLIEIGLKSVKLHNHLTNNYIISNKKALFYTMSQYYEASQENVFDYLPLTFHIQNGLQDPQYLKFLNLFYQKAKNIRKHEKQSIDGKKPRNIWIVKPGQFTNRGNGINVCLGLEEIKQILKRKQVHENGNLKTYIIQSYLDRPFLYYRRKFDIRHYMMITSTNGRIKGYWYQRGYIRTTSAQYTVKTALSSIHLTNDAVQKYLPDYGKYQKGNKVSYQDFQKYLEKQYNQKFNFFTDVYPIMKKIATDAIRASALVIDPERKQHNFEVFGMDFMIDEDFKPWLIEINNNPCLELSCPLLADIIPEMVQNTLKICLDSIVPPPTNFIEKRANFNDNCLSNNKYELVYDSVTEQQNIKQLFSKQQIIPFNKTQFQKQDDEVFQDDGNELDD